jgi:PGM1 C-terminal domain
VDDVVEAIRQLISANGSVGEVIVKVDVGVGGLGNGIVRLEGAAEPKEIAARVRAVQPDDSDLLPETFLEELSRQSGVVELRLRGSEVRSPSAQMRSGPGGEFELVSTHDQILGGANGMTYLGCRFPAHRSYRKLISDEAIKIGRRLTREGMVGRFSVDFIVTREANGPWKPYAIEINLRNGGTTHPWMATIALTDGSYDEEAGELLAADGRPRCYIASDHVESPAYHALTPDDILDLAQTRLRWDHERLSGVVFHLVSAIAGGGRTGVTAIAERPEEAREMFDAVTTVLDETASRRVPRHATPALPTASPGYNS